MLTGISRIWKNSEETSETHRNPELRTRYYLSSGKVLFRAIAQLIEEKLPNWTVTHVDDERLELMVEKKTPVGVNDIVVSVYEVTPSKSAVDMVTYNRGILGDFGTGRVNIKALINEIDAQIKRV